MERLAPSDVGTIQVIVLIVYALPVMPCDDSNFGNTRGPKGLDLAVENRPVTEFKQTRGDPLSH